VIEVVEHLAAILTRFESAAGALTRFAPPSRILRSRLTDLGALAAVVFALAASFGDNAVLYGLVENFPPPHYDRLEAILWSHFGTSMLASLCLTPLAAAGLLRLRSA
jgi:hypothetical protein